MVRGSQASSCPQRGPLSGPWPAQAPRNTPPSPRMACQVLSSAPPTSQEEDPVQRTEGAREGLGPAPGHPWCSSQARPGPGLPGVPSFGLWCLWGPPCPRGPVPWALLWQGCGSEPRALRRPPAPRRPTRTSASSCCRLSLPSTARSRPSRWNSWSCRPSALSASSRTCFRSASFSRRLCECCACSSSRVAMACGGHGAGRPRPRAPAPGPPRPRLCLKAPGVRVAEGAGNVRVNLPAPNPEEPPPAPARPGAPPPRAHAPRTAWSACGGLTRWLGGAARALPPVPLCTPARPHQRTQL